MSTLQPYIDMPYPNYAMEEELAPNRVDPVPEVTPVVPVRPVEPFESRAPGEEVVPADAVEFSAAAREISEENAAGSVQRDSATLSGGTRFDPVANAERIRDNLAIRDLIASFDNYDNSNAQARFNSYMQYFVNYAAAAGASGDAGLADVRNRENALYASLGFMLDNAATASTPIAERMALAIDSWLNGTGIFQPAMLGYSSSDGFRFTPLTEASRASLRAADALASYERSRIAQYLREMATLTPEDFMFYDPTGLGALPLQERRDFLQRMDELLEQARIDARASELRYVFNENGQLVPEELGLADDSELQRLEAMEEIINSYYAMLIASVQQYKSGIISSSLG